MGGWGSGRARNFGSLRETDFSVLDILDLVRAYPSLLRGAENMDFIFTRLGKTWTKRFHFTRTACFFGGQRIWFVCPGCGRRAAKLYGRWDFRCRRCRGFHYDSQYDRMTGTANRLNRIEAKLKRKGLHLWTIIRLEEQRARGWGRVGRELDRQYRTIKERVEHEKRSGRAHAGRGPKVPAEEI